MSDTFGGISGFQQRTTCRTGTAAEWAAVATTEVLAKGELGFDSTNKILKIGDGVTPWGSLAVAASWSGNYSMDDILEGLNYKRITADKANIVNSGDVSSLVPNATTTVPGKILLASTGSQDASRATPATAAEIAALLTAGGYSLSPATGVDNLDNIADGVNYKRIKAAPSVILNNTTPSALWDYTKAVKTPPDLLTEMVESASNGEATVKYDDLGFPSMMYVIPGPILAGHIHADMGSTTGIKTAVVAAGGTGYSVGDILTIAGGTGGTVRVLTVSSGAVTSVQIANPGTGYTATTGAATTGGTGSGCTITITVGPVHPAFSVGGVEKLELLVAMYKMTSFNGTSFHGSGTGWRAVSWPGLYPTGSLDFDASKAIHTQKGTGWHMMSMWERALIMWISMKMGTEPRGNTYYGRSHESGYEYECAVRSDGLAPGYAGGTAKHRNGSSPSKWSHNGERWGIHDLVGSMYEWTDLFKLVDGLIKMPNDNNFALAEASWPSQGVYLDNTAAGSGGAPRLNASLVNVLTDPNYSSVTHNALTMTAEYDALDPAVRQRMLAAGVSPKIASGGTNPWSPKGTLYMRNFGERLPFCGGFWGDTSVAGLASLNLNNLRSHVYSYIGSRSAFISV